MSAFKVTQNIGKLTASVVSGPIALKSGYLRITPEAAAYVDVGYAATASTTNSLYIPANETVILKESVYSQPIEGVTRGSTTTITFPSGVDAVVGVGDFVEVTGLQPSGANSTFAEVTAVYGPSPTDSFVSGRIVLNYNTSSVGVVTVTSGAEIRKATKIATNSTGVTHVTEVQITGG